MTVDTRAPAGAQEREVPRRIRMDRWTPAEHAIHDAVEAVERTGADERLTRAVILLQEARTLVADFVDDAEAPAPHLQTRDRPRCGLCMTAIPLDALAAGKGMLGGGAFICEDCIDNLRALGIARRLERALSAPADATERPAQGEAEPACEKCGGTNISTAYRAKGERFEQGIGTSRAHFDLLEEECLRRYCRTCGYTWQEPTRPFYRRAERAAQGEDRGE